MVNASNAFRSSINTGNRDGIMNVEIELNYTINKTHIKLTTILLKRRTIA